VKAQREGQQLQCRTKEQLKGRPLPSSKVGYRLSELLADSEQE
jgi:hypothetical protein